MPRKYSNETQEFYINNSTNKQTMSLVKLPTYKRITHRIKIGDHFDGSPQYATTEIITNQPPPKDMDVVKTEDLTIPLHNECPTCHTEARPRLGKRSNRWDYRYRKSLPRKPFGVLKYETNRRDSYFLVYHHKNGKKCNIMKFDENHGIFTEKGSIFTKLKQFMFPYCVEPQRRELRDFESFKNFFNAI